MNFFVYRSIFIICQILSICRCINHKCNHYHYGLVVLSERKKCNHCCKSSEFLSLRCVRAINCATLTYRDALASVIACVAF